MSINFLALNEMKNTPHPPHSPDLAPSDFSLFSHVKRNLMGYRAESLSELLFGIQVILKVIPCKTLIEVFLKWTK
jgi:hypothetical protein